MLIPHAAIFAERLIAFRILRQRAIPLVIATRRWDAGSCHPFHPLALILLLPLPLLALCDLPRAMDWATMLCAVQPVHREGCTGWHLVPRLAMDRGDAPLLLNRPLAIQVCEIACGV